MLMKKKFFENILFQENLKLHMSFSNEFVFSRLVLAKTNLIRYHIKVATKRLQMNFLDFSRRVVCSLFFCFKASDALALVAPEVVLRRFCLLCREQNNER